MMHKLQAAPIEIRTDSRIPLVPEQYERSSNLTDAERAALVEVLAFQGGNPTGEPYRSSIQILAHLIQPLKDVYGLWHTGAKTDYTVFLRWMCQRMVQTGKPYWVWTMEEWIEAISLHNGDRHRGVPKAVRITAYLFCGFLIITDLRFSSSEMAQVVFGTEIVLEQFERLVTIVCGEDGFGYSGGEATKRRFIGTVTLLMLVNRNPYIDMVSIESLRTAKQLIPDVGSRLNELSWIVRALISLKILSEDALADLFGHPETTKWWERIMLKPTNIVMNTGD
jgi:hypothetical protein